MMSSDQIIDSYGRTMRYLRLSVTDRCNLRCFYCMPKEGIEYVAKEELLSYEEMFRIIRLLHTHGVNKVRITGGEPFARKNLMTLLRRLPQLEGLGWHMTTNAVLIEPFIAEMASLGVRSVNVSLDALDREKFRRITRRDAFDTVIANVMRLLEHDIPVRINCVVMKGRNEDQILPLAALAEKHPLDVRFIEEMPFNGTSETRPVMNYRDILSVVRESYDLRPAGESGGTSEVFTAPDLQGRIGVIPAFTRTFCGTCDRLRISATGALRTCLYGADQLNLVTLIREGADDDALLEAICQAVARKEKDGFEAERNHQKFPNTSMSIIGG